MSAQFSGAGGPMSPDAVEGRAAHHVAETVLMGDATCAADLVGRMSPDGFYITQEMTNHVQGYLDYIGRPSMMLVEHGIKSGYIGCRVDCAIDHGNYFEVIDFKYGWRVHEPFYNPQLLIGAALLAGSAHQRVKLTIYQPRPFHREGVCRSHEISMEDLAYRWQHIQERAVDTTRANPPASPGPHCENCPGAAKCAALTINVYSAYELIERGGFGTLSADAMRREFVFLTSMQDLVKARLNAIRAEIESRLRSGEYVPGMWLKPSYGHRVFTVPLATVEAITGHAPVKTVNLTPADLEKEGVSPTILAKVSTVPEIGRKVAVLTEKEIERMFNRGR
jgi:hypothetical protein